MTLRDTIELLLLGAIWGASFLFMRIAAPEFGPIPLIAARVGIAAVFLLAIVATRGSSRQLYVHARPLIVLGALSAAAPFTLFAYALLSLTAGFTSVLNATVPLFGALVAYFWLGDKLSQWRILGLVIGFAGVLLLVADKASVARDGSGWAILAGLSAAFLYGISANFIKKHMTGIDPLINATGSEIAATAMLLIPAIVSWPAQSPSMLAWVSAISLGIFCTGVAVAMFFRLVARIGPAKTVTVTYLIPVFAVLWGFLFLDEAISARMVAGCAVILLGTSLASGLIGSQR
ncbi:MAG TPA: DMT family transporter [Vicinamibacterales bacterium]|nr:DMT family transporter [Vicinamibacterales bacterium]